VYMYMYICIYVYMYICIYVYMYLSKVSFSIQRTFLDRYCSTVQGLLDWFEVDLGFTELLFIQINLCVMLIQYPERVRWKIKVHSSQRSNESLTHTYAHRHPHTNTHTANVPQRDSKRVLTITLSTDMKKVNAKGESQESGMGWLRLVGSLK